VRLDRVDRWLGPGLLLLAFVWLWLVYTYIPDARNEGEPGPRAFPVLLGFALAGLGALVTLSAFVTGKGKAPEQTERVSRREAAVVFATFGLLMLYGLMLDKAGFLIATPIAVTLTMFGILRMRNWILVLTLAGGLTAGCWFFFAVLLKTPLPHGAWLM